MPFEKKNNTDVTLRLKNYNRLDSWKIFEFFNLSFTASVYREMQSPGITPLPQVCTFKIVSSTEKIFSWLNLKIIVKDW